MSSHDKDPLQKQDTSSESSKSSDSEIDEAEEDLGHLKIEGSATKEKKDDSDESKPPNRKGISTRKLDLLNEPTPGPSGHQKPRQVVLKDPVAGPSGLQKPRQELLNEPVAGPSGLQKTKVKAKSIEEVIGARMEEGESDQYSARGTHSDDVLKQPHRDVVGSFMDHQSSSSGLSLESSSSRRSGYASDSASTSADVSEIRSEMADSSREESVYRDAPEDFMKEESSSYASALETQPSSETSDTNISDIQDFVPPLTPESRSVSISTNTGEQGNRAYIDQIRREAAARGSLTSTSSGIASTDQSELAHQQDWILAGQMGFYRPNVDDPNRDLSDDVAEGAEPLSISESIEDEPNLDQQMQDFDRLFRQEQPNVEGEEMNVPEDERGSSARRSRVERAVRASGKGAGSPYKRRPLKCPSDSVISELEAIENPRPKHKPIAGKKSKMDSSDSRLVLQSSSESPEPKSSSSEELHRKESPDIESSSGSQEISKTRSVGILQRRQHAMSSMDPVVIDEEEDKSSSLREQDPGSIETEDPSPETIPEKGGIGAAEITETSEAKLSTESTDQAYGSETDGTLKEREEISEDLGFERSVGKSKREPKPSNSPPSNEKPDPSAPKATTSRPKKRARSEKIHGKRCRARHDSGGNVPKSVGLGNIKESESTSSSDVSDCTASDDEKDTQS